MTQMNVPMKRNQRLREQTSAGLGERFGGGVEWEIRVRCKFVYLEWINNKVLLYSTENYKGKEYF